MYRRYVSLLFRFALTGFLLNALETIAQNPLQNQLDVLVSDPFFKKAAIGISIRNAETGEAIAGIHHDLMLIPASGMKLITTLSGYQLLGKDFNYSTGLCYDGGIDGEGKLVGNIYIQGSGDPTLGSERIAGNPDANTIIQRMLDDIRNAGIDCVEGDIVVDPNVFKGHPVHPSWKWDDLGNYYAAGAWGLNFNENQYRIFYNSNGKLGSRTRISHIEPEIPGLEIDNSVRVNRPGTGDRANIYGGPFEYKKKVTGTIPKSRSLFSIKGSIPDPPRFVADCVLRNMENLDMGGREARINNFTVGVSKNLKEIATYNSPPLRDIIRHTNSESINIYAESIIKTIGRVTMGVGDEINGGIAIKKFMNTLGVDTSACRIVDGSGLSVENRITPACMSEFLVKIMPMVGKDTLFNIIPKAGVEGTVKNLLVRSPAKGNMWVKSGSMRKILTYSGYCIGASGNLVTFSVILNRSVSSGYAQNKKHLEKILEAIYRFS